MWKALASFFKPPVFADNENKTRSAFYGHVITLAVIALILIYESIGKILAGSFKFNILDPILAGLFVVLLIVLGMLRSGYVTAANAIFVTMLWSTINIAAFFGFGIRDSAYIANFIAVLAAGLLLGWQTAVTVAALSILTGIGLAYAELHQISPNAYYTSSPSTVAQDLSLIFVIYAVFIFLLISGLNNAIKSAQAGTRKLEAVNRELYDSQVRLEENRNELLVANEKLQRRAERISTIADISRVVTSVQDEEKLLDAITRSISQQLDYYHVGIFLIDLQRQFAVLRAANSEAGRQMINRRHQLRLDANSIVGLAASRGEPRTSQDADESVYFSSPDLPTTHSEMALPLIVGEQVIGVLDIQSTLRDAFPQEDIDVLTILADQIAVAIENARLFGRSQQALEESQQTFSKYIRQEWSDYARQARQTGFIYDGRQIIPLTHDEKREERPTVIQTGMLSLQKASPNIAVPIKLRGQVIGTLDVRTKNGEREWSQGEIALLMAAADRAALALENARLVENAQRRAARERSIGDISSKIGSVSDVDTILQTAVEELGRKIGSAAEVVLELNTENV